MLTEVGSGPVLDVLDTAVSGINVQIPSQGGDGIYVTDGSLSDVSVSGGATDTIGVLAQHTVAVTNSAVSLVVADQASGIGSFVGGGTAALHHDTIVSQAPGSGVGLIVQGGSNTQMQLDGTVISGFGQGLRRLTVGASAPPQLTLVHSVWDASQDSLGSDPSGVAVNGTVNADPQLLDPAHGDYRLRSTSPAIDLDTNSANAKTDIDGHPSVDGNGDGIVGADAGAFEYLR